LSAASDIGHFQKMMYFWFIAGTLTGLCAAIVALPFMRGAIERLERRRVIIAALAVLAFAGCALILYQKIGRPELLGSRVVSAPAAHPGVGGSDASAAESMQESVARLEARLSRDGGKREDWLLLAQSYEFMGRTQDAQRAREKAEAGGTLDWAVTTTPGATTAASPAPGSDSAAEYQRRVRAKPDDAEAWQMLAVIYRRAHDYAKAKDALATLVKLAPNDADAWADYADTLASAAGGSLRGAPAKAIDTALRLDPTHTKALWLKASLAHEEHRYGDALRAWKQLQAVLPPDSSDARIVAANIAEAAALSGQPPSSGNAGSAGAEVSGTVAVDKRLAAKVPDGATLFIYAKAADSPGPPLAVLRQPAGAWPVDFRLDDTLAMIPSRKLSQFERVIVEARISRSGQATPTAGDLYVTSDVLKPAERKKVALVINREVS
jgi:cytochrome c-type biogenesis protein CcmH/NrfG